MILLSRFWHTSLFMKRQRHDQPLHMSTEPTTILMRQITLVWDQIFPLRISSRILPKVSLIGLKHPSRIYSWRLQSNSPQHQIAASTIPTVWARLCSAWILKASTSRPSTMRLPVPRQILSIRTALQCEPGMC